VPSPLRSSFDRGDWKPGIRELQACGSLVFFRSLLRDPRSVGAVAPSSPRLSRLVASSVSPNASTILEVGAGTGAITGALLDRGIDPRRIFIIERDPELVDYLCARFPRVRVRCGDAIHATAILREERVGKIDTLLSSLPIRNFKPKDQMALMRAMLRTLEPGGQLVQYTYGPNCPIPARPLGLRAECLGRVWMNLPPAAVWRFTRHAL
jgi:phosphatidylethanolamine/phosphatidyl-N-methylethanolamine N-methyltransferase